MNYDLLVVFGLAIKVELGRVGIVCLAAQQTIRTRRRCRLITVDHTKTQGDITITHKGKRQFQAIIADNRTSKRHYQQQHGVAAYKKQRKRDLRTQSPGGSESPECLALLVPPTDDTPNEITKGHCIVDKDCGS